MRKISAEESGVPKCLLFSQKSDMRVHRKYKTLIADMNWVFRKPNVSFSEPYYNLPKLSSCTSWNPSGITVLNSSSIGSTASGIFITVNDTIFLAVPGRSQAQMWLPGSTTPARALSTSGFTPSDVFVTSNGDIYVDNGVMAHQVDRWTINVPSAMNAMYVSVGCSSLFVDINNHLYCSFEAPDQVIKRWLNGPLNSSTLAAGNGTRGNTSNLLYAPRGIFVDRELCLYVADCYNHRVQVFPRDHSNGTTAAGNGAPGTITLNLPVDVILDADGHLFIADSSNNRIVASGPNGFRCIIACSGASGSATNMLSNPVSLSFGSVGDLFVTDGSNGRVQRFLIARNSCGELSF